jgi:murein peptide amidase A
VHRLIHAAAHRAHDYRFLIQRWRVVAQRCGLKLQRWTIWSGFPLYLLRTKALSTVGGMYLSAGIHGDEAGSTEGLIAWAEKEGKGLRDLPVLIFPCLNPWGLVNNSRFDHSGLDLNRLFHREDIPYFVDWQRAVGDRQFRVALMLHEDYDGQGFYIYEVQKEKPHWGEGLLDAVRPVLPIESRISVDGRKSRSGLIRRRFNLRWFEKMGYPEAIWLHMHHSARAFTAETPSEFAIEQRALAHVALIDECIRRLEWR